MANTVQIIINATDNASSVFKGVTGSAQSMGRTFTSVGTQMTIATAATNLALGAATRSAVGYDESITNAAAILGSTIEEQEAMSQSLLDFSRTAGHGGQVVADAFFDIVSGVADTSTHMAILTASSATAEAGQADLISTNAALISSMNAYSFSADKATFVSDVMTRTVQGGVITMDQLAASLPQVTTQAGAMGIGLDEVSASLAFMTTKGKNANRSSTAINALMISLSKPTALLTEAFTELGFETGQAAIDALGFQGAIQAVAETSVVAENGLNAVIGSSNATQAAMILASEGAEEFSDTFVNSVDGATAAAGEIQFRAAQAHIDLFKSNVEGLAITIGNILLPQLVGMMDRGVELVDSLINWIGQNEELTSSVVLAVAAIGTVGPAFMLIGTIIGIIASPITFVVAALAGLGIAFRTNFLGIRSVVEPIINWFVGGVEAMVDQLRLVGIWVENGSDLFTVLFTTFEDGSSAMSGILEGFGLSESAANSMGATINDLVGNFAGLWDTFVQGVGTAIGVLISIWDIVSPPLMALANFFLVDVVPRIIDMIVNQFIRYITILTDFLSSLWVIVQPHLQNLADFFLTTALPQIMAFINNVVMPGLQLWMDLLAGFWSFVAEGLLFMVDWFLNTGLPAVVAYIENTVVPGIQIWINILLFIWDIVQPALVSLADWFLNTGLPAVDDFIQNTIVPGIQIWIDILTSVWGLVQPALNSLVDWFITSGLPLVVEFINNVIMPVIDTFINVLETIWDVVGFGLRTFVDFITTVGFPLTVAYMNDIFIPVIQAIIDIIGTIWTLSQPVLIAFGDGIDLYFNASLLIIDAVADGIQDLIRWIESIDLGILEDAANTVGDITSIGSGGSDFFGGILSPAGFISNVLGFAAGTPFTGGGNPNDIAGVVHNQEGVVPRGGAPVIMPSPKGFILENMPEGGGSNTQVSIQITVPEAQILTPALAEENGMLFGQRINEELNFNG